MLKRYAAIWFYHLTSDRMVLRRPRLKNTPFVLAAPEHGRMIVTGVSPAAGSQGVTAGMAVADAKVFVPGLEVVDHLPGMEEKLLKVLGLWCLRYTPVIAMDPPGGLILDITGCAHLWGGEKAYLKAMSERLKDKGYHTRIAIADTIGAAWAVSRFGTVPIVESGSQVNVLQSLPPAALRLETGILQRLHKLGLYKTGDLMSMPAPALRRRFGEGLLLRLRQALGNEEEFIQPLQPPLPYEERLSSMEGVRTPAGIALAIQQLLEILCKRLSADGKGLRSAILICYRVDGETIKVQTGTSRATADASHIFRLFELKIPQIDPALGIELFVLQASKVEDMAPFQETFWAGKRGLADKALSELLDRLTVKTGNCIIRRYLPQERYWPERSVKAAVSIMEKPATGWCEDKLRPIYLLAVPQPVEVSAPIPDYPPMLFRYKDKVHKIRKADGPERIEREWWLDKGVHRDYYRVEDEDGQRYWIFRSGHYTAAGHSQWFLHGFFA